MYKLSFEIKTLAPVVISSAGNSSVMTSTHSEISGSIIRGVLAKKYISEKKLKTPHLDDIFRKFFYGDLKFLAATPEVSGRRSFILPLSLQKGKTGTKDEKNILDLFTVEEIPKGYKSFRGYGADVGEKIFTAEVKKNISLHMSRNLEKERLSGKSSEGHIYNYESIAAGQKFFGAIVGEKNDLKKFSDALNLENSSENIFVGKSHFTQYGKCKITFGGVEEISLPSVPKKIYLCLESPLVPPEDYFTDAKRILQAEIADVANKIVGEDIFSIGKIFSSSVEVENFVTHWAVKRPRVQALAAGTVFELRTEKILSPENFKRLAEKIFSGFGMRTEEGFGQASFWEARNFTYAQKEKNEPKKPEKFSDTTIKIAEKILSERFFEQVRMYAYDDAKKLNLGGENLTHFFSRLSAILSNSNYSDDVRQNFITQLNLERRSGSLFDDNLKKLKMTNGQTFFDVFNGKADFPRSVEEIKKDLKLDELFGELEISSDFLNKKFFAEYLQNYFKAARKFAATKGGDFNE